MMMSATTDPKRTEPFEIIVGEKLSAVTFVMDYWQLQFDGPMINVMSRLEVCGNGVVSRDGDDQFRNHLCGQIAKVVTRLQFLPKLALALVFEDGSTISILLREEDFRGPEAAVLFGAGMQLLAAIRQGDL